MKRIAMIAVVAAGLVACGKGDDKGSGGKGGSGAPGTDTPSPRRETVEDIEACEEVGSRTTINANQQIPDDAAADLREQLQRMNNEVGRAITIRCMDDGWSDEVVACGQTARDPQLECFDKLTATQAQKVRDQIQSFVEGVLQAPRE